MKKLFTLALVLLVPTAGYSQVRKTSIDNSKKKAATVQTTKGMESFENVQIEPNMMRSEGELDYSTYDWQTNHGFINRTVVWPDGKVNFAYTVSSQTNFSDRGTGIGTYDYQNDDWIQLGGRIESEKTGFGSIARYKDNGLVVAAHTATNMGIYIVEDKDNMTPNSVPNAIYTGSDVWSHPCVTTSGPERSIIHMVGAKFEDGEDEYGIAHGIRYWRSKDGMTWDKEAVVLPFLTADYGTEHGTNSYYWMETTEDNCIGLVINTGYTDGMVLYSYDDGETWERKVYFHDPAPGYVFGEDEPSFCYPRYTSALWNSNKELMLAYEYNYSDHAGHYTPAYGGVAFWSEYMPFYGDENADYYYGFDPNNPMPPVHGQPFIMDSAYLYEDIELSNWFWSNSNHEMWPEYFGYLTTLTDDGEWEDPYTATEWNIENVNDLGDLHGTYNVGNTGFPVLCKVNNSDSDLVAVWSSLDENNKDGANKYYFKLFAAFSGDAGLTWSHMKQLTTDFMYELSECVYPQAAVVGTTLIVAAQLDQETGTYVQNDESTPDDNYYQGFTFELDELFPGVGVSEVSHNTHMSIYPNPAVDRLNVTLSQNADIVIYNIMGQNVMNVEGHAGANCININELGAGIYFISAGSDIQKFIVK
jgi:hypothetical protein